MGLGGDLKNTICIANRNRARISGTHGDLADVEAYRRWHAAIRAVTPRQGTGAIAVGHDLHPSYFSTRIARMQPGISVAVQHHFAHAVSCAVDAGVAFPVIGVVCDGTGYGTDGAIWGGEVLLCEVSAFQRLAHLDYFSLAGGDSAARFPFLPAAALLLATFGKTWRRLPILALRVVEERRLEHFMRQLSTGLNVSATSSMGRLFDAVSWLSGLCIENTHEGEAAIALQGAAAEALSLGQKATRSYEYELRPGDGVETVIDWRPMVVGIVRDVQENLPATVIASKFHATVVAMLAEAAHVVSARTGIDRVVLSGGCFMNDLLRGALASTLQSRGLTVSVHGRVACGDAGLSLGQAVVAAHVAAKRESRSKRGQPCA